MPTATVHAARRSTARWCAIAPSSPTTASPPGSTAPRPRRRALAAVPGLDEQLRLQDRVAQALKRRRHEHGALEPGDDRGARRRSTATPRPTCARDEKNRAKELIEDFMIAANGVTARFLERAGLAVAAPGAAHTRSAGTASSRWPRELGERLPAAPDAARARSVPRTAAPRPMPRAFPTSRCPSSSFSARASTSLELPGAAARGTLRPRGAATTRTRPRRTGAFPTSSPSAC